MAFLINAKAEESISNTGNLNELMDYYNKFEYSLAGGLEIHRFKGLLIGGRYNLSLAELYKDLGTGFTGTITSFISEVNVKNNVVTHRIPRRE